MQTNSSIAVSPIRAIRQKFHRSIRKDQIQKIQKQRRFKQMKTSNPIVYASKIKEVILQEQMTSDKIRQTIQFVSINISNLQFADFIENQQLIESLIIRSIYTIHQSQQSSEYDSLNIIQSNEQNNKYIHCIFPKKCQCFDCAQKSTQTTDEFYQRTEYCEQIEIDKTFNNLSMQSLDNDLHQSFSVLLDIISLLNQVYENSRSGQNNNNTQWSKIVQNKKTEEFTKFQSLLMNVPEILETIVLDLLQFKECNYQEQGFEKINQPIQNSNRVDLTIKILDFLSKISKLCWFKKSAWFLLMKIYQHYFLTCQTENKNQNKYFLQIKNFFKLMYKSYILKQLLPAFQKFQQFNALLFPCIKTVSQILKIKSNEQYLDNLSLQIFFRQELQFFVKILSDLTFIPINIIEEVKQILGELLNLSKFLEQKDLKPNNEVEFFYISKSKGQKQQPELLARSKFLSEKLVQILYLQMQLADEDLYRIINAYPSIKETVQQIIDADMY